MVESVTLSCAVSDATLQFHDPVRGRSGELYRFTVTLTDRGLTASSDVTVHDASIADLFDEMAREWKGWKGAKEVRSTEYDIHLACTSDGFGHAYVEVTLSSGPNRNRDWQVTGTLRLDAQPLIDASQRLQSFFRQDRDAG